MAAAGCRLQNVTAARPISACLRPVAYDTEPDKPRLGG